MRFLRFLPCLVLTGCASISQPEDNKKQLELIFSSYTMSQKSIMMYGTLPNCDFDAGYRRFCKDQATWSRIRTADIEAVNAINLARSAIENRTDAKELDNAILATKKLEMLFSEASDNMYGLGRSAQIKE